jgi:hypothetical protein
VGGRERRPGARAAGAARPAARPAAGAAPAAGLLSSGAAADRCAAAAGGSAQPGTPVVLSAGCDAASGARRFALTAAGQLTAFDGAACVDLEPGAEARGAGVVLAPCAPGAATQRWARTAAGELVGAEGLCLTVNDAAPGRWLGLWTCGGFATQKWEVASAP